MADSVEVVVESVELTKVCSPEKAAVVTENGCGCGSGDHLNGATDTTLVNGTAPGEDSTICPLKRKPVESVTELTGDRDDTKKAKTDTGMVPTDSGDSAPAATETAPAADSDSVETLVDSAVATQPKTTTTTETTCTAAAAGEDLSKAETAAA
jgi:hypothetical protein